MYLADQLVPWGLPAILKQVNTSPSTRARRRAGWAILQQEVPSDSVWKTEMGWRPRLQSLPPPPWGPELCPCVSAWALPPLPLLLTSTGTETAASLKGDILLDRES